MPKQKQIVSSGTKWEEMASYSRGVRVGDNIYIAGTTASGPDGLVGGDDPAAQAHFIFDKIKTAIEQLGGRFEDIVRTRVFISNVENWEPIARAHGERLKGILPANTLVEARLVGPEFLVEIEADAVVGAGSSAETNA